MSVVVRAGGIWKWPSAANFGGRGTIVFVNLCGWVQFCSARVGVVVVLGVLDNAGCGTSGCGSAAAALQT